MFKVTATLQSGDNVPVDVVWSKSTDALGVVLCVSQILSKDKADEPFPYPDVLAITILPE